MAPRSPPRAGSVPAARWRRRPAAPAAAEAPPAGASQGFEEVAARAARLGITVERVLEEYAHIAFSDLSHIVEWTEGGLAIKPAARIGAGETAAISEIAGPGSGSGHVRVKLYDKKAALDAIARHLGMFPVPRRHDGDAPPDPAEDPRDVLKRRLARLAADGGEDASGERADPGPGPDDQP